MGGRGTLGLDPPPGRFPVGRTRARAPIRDVPARPSQALPRASRREFDELGDLVRPDRSHAALRQAMRAAAKRPVVPYLGLYLTDLTFIEDGNKDWVADSSGNERLVNMSKCATPGQPHYPRAARRLGPRTCRTASLSPSAAAPHRCAMVGKALSEILHFQRHEYDLEPNEAVAIFFTSLEPPDDEEIYALSLVCEPRDGDGASTPSPSGRPGHTREPSSGSEASMRSGGGDDGGFWRPPTATRPQSSSSFLGGIGGAATIPRVSPRDMLRAGITATVAASALASRARKDVKDVLKR